MMLPYYLPLLVVFSLSSYFLFFFLFFFFNDTATTEIYTLSLHDALPISDHEHLQPHAEIARHNVHDLRSEEHTSELQSLAYLVCRLLLQKKKNNIITSSSLKKKKKKKKQQKKYKKK